MAAKRNSRCPHSGTAQDNTWHDVLAKRQAPHCDLCDQAGPNLWVCLYSGCLFVGCGDASYDHSTIHGESQRHPLTMNMSTLRIWCYMCEIEVFRDDNFPPFSEKMRLKTVVKTGEGGSLPEVVESQTHYVPHDHYSQGGGEEESSSEDEDEDAKPTGNAMARWRGEHGVGARVGGVKGGEEEESSSEDEDEDAKPTGLTGLQNIGNTCYMNAALQALSNCPPLTRFFLDCSGYARGGGGGDRKSMLARSYQRLVSDMWHKRRPSYLTPSSVSQGFKMAHPMFRGYSQQDSQEFLRCFMDQLHEELKQVAVSDGHEDDQSSDHSSDHSLRDHPPLADRQVKLDACFEIIDELKETNVTNGQMDDRNSHHNLHDHPPPTYRASSGVQSEDEYETCDSGLSSDSLTSTNTDDDNTAKRSDWRGGAGTGEGSRDSGVSAVSVVKEGSSVVKEGASVVNEGAQTEINAPLAAVHRPPDIRRARFKAKTKDLSTSDSELAIRSESRDGGSTCSGAEWRGATHARSDSDGRLSPPPPPAAARCLRSSRRSVSESCGQHARKPSPTHSPHSSAHSTAHSTPGMDHAQGEGGKRAPREYHSVISDVFDGRLLSSVQCLTCERISATRETFQDLSLPIPSRDQVRVLSSQPGHRATCDTPAHATWISSMYGWMKTWLWGPAITLQDCLSAFFSADELKGDNMYSCDKCKKLRNGIKYSRVLKLPEVLSIHLKRFRHEFMFSSKISTQVSFPLNSLDMRPYLHKDCGDAVTEYDLVAVICHHGTAGGGHYTAYALNHVSDQWYEFDDQYVTEVDPHQVEQAEAYVLFYRKKNEHMVPVRKHAGDLLKLNDATFMKFWISRQWINKFNTFAEPGPISNHDFICSHGSVYPALWSNVDALAMEVPHALWNYCHRKYGGGPAMTHLQPCATCLEEQERLARRQQHERNTFSTLHEAFEARESGGAIYAVSMAWFKQWESFVRGRTPDPPGPVDNSRICAVKQGAVLLKRNSDFGQMSADTWRFLHGIYGGGPEVVASAS